MTFEDIYEKANQLREGSRGDDDIAKHPYWNETIYQAKRIEYFAKKLVYLNAIIPLRIPDVY
jgi:hypothetical protein